MLGARIIAICYNRHMLEHELFSPVVALLESQGYHVKGEIGALDIFGMKNDVTIGVELKVKIALKLIYQAVDRQKLCDVVYLALPEKVVHTRNASYRSFTALLRRLELGLIIVNNQRAYVEIEAVPYDRERSRIANKKKTQRLVKEFTSRENNTTIGGKQGQRLTAYREKCIKIATFMVGKDSVSPSEVKAALQINEVAAILRNNYYRWFDHPSKGKYCLSKTYFEEHL